jgi:spermidine/putrescine transport system permease protein
MPERSWLSFNAFYFVLLVLFLYLPLVLLIIFSFNDARSLAFPLSGFTTKWYAALFDTPELLEAAWNSVLLGVGSSLVATILGTMAAIGLVRFRFLGRRAFLAIAAMPLVIPSVVLGVAMLIGFAQVGLPLSLWTVGVGHVVINIPVVILIVAARLAGLEANLEEAAMDLGTTYLEAQLRVTLPLSLPAVIAAFLTSFTTSFDEFALAFFLIGPQPTLPIYLYSQLRFPTRLPIVIAMASIVIAGSILVILLTDRLRRLGQPLTWLPGGEG